jgi:SAM-dependent methyltransferase|tara:strand:- start:12311 stop:12904 length:594 start_codon:yes stop_codon:yes gene_type:complete
MPLPFSQACENNKAPILAELLPIFVDAGLVLEVGSGTGQHAAHFAAALPHLRWQPTDHPDSVHNCRERLQVAALPNVAEPLALDVAESLWPVTYADMAFSANTAHIMCWKEVESMFRGLGRVLRAHGVFCLYGPFRYAGRYTSASNAAFDAALQARAAHMGLRDIDDLLVLARDTGFELEADRAMPANNQLLVWRRY